MFYLQTYLISTYCNTEMFFPLNGHIVCFCCLHTQENIFLTSFTVRDRFSNTARPIKSARKWIKILLKFVLHVKPHFFTRMFLGLEEKMVCASLLIDII